jgi:hypothetical protein
MKHAIEQPYHDIQTDRLIWFMRMTEAMCELDGFVGPTDIETLNRARQISERLCGSAPPFRTPRLTLVAGGKST